MRKRIAMVILFPIIAIGFLCGMVRSAWVTGVARWRDFNGWLSD